MHVLVNAANVVGAGPATLCRNLIPELLQTGSGTRYTLLLPDIPGFRALAIPAPHTVLWVYPHVGFSNNLERIKQIYYAIPRLVRRHHPDLCLTLGDLGPINPGCPHVIFLHNPYFVYSHQELGGQSWPLPKRWYLVSHFALSVQRAARVVVQTPVIRRRLLASYRVLPQRVTEIAQPAPYDIVSQLAPQQQDARILATNKPARLLFLAASYPHKNHAILPQVAEHLTRRGLHRQVQIFVTLDEELPAWHKLQLALAPFDCVTNLGRLQPGAVMAALQAATAFFVPTLAETYGLSYLEAMAAGRPILTSDRDFARWMCGDLARYFDPFDPQSIVDAIEAHLHTPPAPSYQARALQRLHELPQTWATVATAFEAVMQQAVR